MRRSILSGHVLLVVAALAACAREPDPSPDLARLQVLATQVQLVANDATNGNEDAFKELAAMGARFDALQIGVPAERARSLDAARAQLSADVKKLLGFQAVVQRASAATADFEAKIDVFRGRLDEVVKQLGDHGGSTAQVLIAARERLLLERMSRRAALIKAAGDESQSAADGFARDTLFFRVVLEGLCKGNEDLKIKPMTDRNVLEILQDVLQQWVAMEPDIQQLLEAVPALQDARQAADSTRIDGQTVVLKAEGLVHERK